MPFQALPIAMRRNTGSPLSKLLLMHLTARCPMPDADAIAGQISPGSMLDLDADEAARFCQCSVDDIYGALAELERLRLVYPHEQWLFSHCPDPTKREQRWEFLVVALPLSSTPPEERRRLKASDDQLDRLRSEQHYRCATCDERDDEIESWHVDHILPRSLGGADVEDNCQAICGACNSRKGAKVHWLDFLGGRR